MKKTLQFLSIAIGILVGSASISHAQGYKITNGSGSTTDISGTEVMYNSTGNQHIFYLYVYNETGNEINTVIRRVQLATPPAGFTEELCWGVVGGLGGCYYPISTPNFRTPDDGVILDDANPGELKITINPNGADGNLAYRYYIEDLAGTVYDSVDVSFNQTASLKEVKNSLSFSVFPNPANDVLTISLANAPAESTVKVVDVLGNVITNEKINGNKKLDVSDYKNGVYFITIANNGTVMQTKRFVVKH